MNIKLKVNKFLSHIGVSDEYGPLGQAVEERKGLVICYLDIDFKQASKMIEKSTGLRYEKIQDHGGTEYSFDYYGLGTIVCYRNKQDYDCIAIYDY